ncbi:MAG: hypoxanthine phosphoribosyltransferase [Bdellovibrionaceae bacterium]|nr:hypoxanthine phosphoribosyltransferase [Bdellovibrionales bacterium]MCB9085521.1 hypoxanthine phosphoribosyltransferase [Pseudobdellovibrionaceae bacterium]
MGQLRDNMISYISAAEIDEMVGRLAEEIEQDYQGKDIVLICPLKGSVLFVADLMRKIRLPQTVDFVHLTSPRGQNVKIIKDISMDISNRHVLIIEEIIDAGRTLSFLEQRLIASRPASLKIVALLDKPARRELPIKPDYVGRTIDDRFVIGYGMDSDEKGRNYRDIFIFAQ